MSIKPWGLAVAFTIACLAVTSVAGQEIAIARQKQDALNHVIQVVKSQPYYALSWHDLKLAVTDEQSANYIKDALIHSGRSAADIMEQSLWVDAAAGHPEAALAFYDDNVTRHPEDKSLSNTACWARAAHGLDLNNALKVCDAALAANRQGYTLVFRGMVELQLGLFDQSLRDFNEALGDKKFQSHPMLADAAYGRGIARIRLGDARGQNDIETAIRAKHHVAASFEDIGITQ